MPGSLASSSMSAVIDADVVCMSQIRPQGNRTGAPVGSGRAALADGDGLEAHAWRQLHAAGHRLHHLRLRCCYFPKAVLESGEHEVFEHRRIIGIDGLRADLDRRD